MENMILKKGSFGKRKIYYRYLKSKKNNIDYYVFFHGVFGSSLKDRYVKIAKRITEENIGNVFLFESSRKEYTFEKKTENFEDYVKTFAGKTFKDELSDVLEIFNFFLERIVNNRSEARLHFVGFSLGGTLLSFLIPKYGHMIKNIYLFGSGITTKGYNKPILSSYPKKEDILSNFSCYQGNVYLIQGTKDNVVPRNEARKIISQAKKAFFRSLFIVRGADHRFLFIDGEPQEAYFNELILNILRASRALT